MLSISDDYELNIRQAPERARVTGLKEKDRKPVDPPPIIQLLIKDPSDPTQNYLQSPYYFMLCNLWDGYLESPARTGSLAGTCVSSLHRLKDVDNTDGGFFVFGDLSVKLEGEYRLRFSLFEMIKQTAQVVYIKSAISPRFTVYAPKNFPGMSESTFLSRSFGDQGVRLRIRKEPRTLLKRSAPSSIRSDEYQRRFSSPTGQGPSTGPSAGPSHAIFAPAGGFGPSPPRDERADYDESSNKRQRSSLDADSRGSYNRNPVYSQSNYTDQLGPYSAYSTQTPQSSMYTTNHTQAPLSAPGGSSEFSFRPPALPPGSFIGSSSYMTSAPQASGYLPPVLSPGYQQQSVYAPSSYNQNHYPLMQKLIPLPSQNIPPLRQYEPVEHSQASNNSVLSRPTLMEDISSIPAGNRPRSSSTRSGYHAFQAPHLSLQTEQLMGPPLQNRQEQLHTPFSNILPPLHSNVLPVPSATSFMPSNSNYVASHGQQSSDIAVQPAIPQYSENFGTQSQEFLPRQQHGESG